MEDDFCFDVNLGLMYDNNHNPIPFFLSDAQFDAVEKLARVSKCEWFYVHQDEKFGDSVYDIESGKLMSLVEALSYLMEAPGVPIEETELTDEECLVIRSLADQLQNFEFVLNV